LTLSLLCQSAAAAVVVAPQLIFSIPESMLRELMPLLVNTSSSEFGKQLQAIAKESAETISKLIYFANEVNMLRVKRMQRTLRESERRRQGHP
jgi:hypothetical protein